MAQLVDTTHVSKRGTSLRVSVPQKVAELLGISFDEVVGFYVDEDGRIVLKRMD